MPNFRQDIRSEQGISLIDMLVATVLLGVAIVALMVGFVYASAGTRDNRDRIQAVMLAQEALENLKRNDGLASPEWAVKSPDPDTGYEVTVIPPNQLVNGLANLRSVTVTVTWTKAGVKRSLSMVEYIYLK